MSSAHKVPESGNTPSNSKKLQLDYGKEQGIMQEHLQKIHTLLKNPEEILEKDRVRLTRVLQILEKFEPERQSAETKSVINLLETFLRILPRSFKKKGAPMDAPSNSYLVAEETIASLRKLRSLDRQITHMSESFLEEEEILDQKFDASATNRETLDTSLSLSYEEGQWGVERICLDGIQNHLPSDSGGKRVWVQCEVNGKWVSLGEAKETPKKITAIRFADDGVGFDVKNLVLLWSSKAQEVNSRGQFGEGMKMIAAASLREKLGMEIQSQSWEATPMAKQVNIQNTRNNKTEKVEQLTFDVQYHQGETPRVGSRTIFHSPTPEFITQVLDMDRKILELTPGYKPLFVAKEGELVRREAGDIFVKGIFIRKEDTLFSYNFDDVETNRDRNTIVNVSIQDRVYAIIKQLNDKRLIKTLLQKSLTKDRALECYYTKTDYPELWKEAFYEAFGEKACVDTNFKPPEIFQEYKVEKVTFPSSIRELLLAAGVQSDRGLIPSFYEETIPTSISLEYGKDIWKEERIMLDAIQNHLPRDAEGGSMYLRFKTDDGKWHRYAELPKYADEHIETIKIANEGNKGYDHRLLGIFHSMKESEEASGKWGEGLKMLSAACLRGGVEMQLKSRSWGARPRIENQEIDGKNIEQLVFDVVHTVRKEKKTDDSNEQYEQSATIFQKPSKELIEEFRTANRKVLAIEQARPLVWTEHGEILHLTNGELFIRDILVPGEHHLRYAYHFPKFDIETRDRNAITKYALTNQLASLWTQVDHKGVIKDFLYQAVLAAKSGKETALLEFQTHFQPLNPDIWLDVFFEIFGKSTSIRNVSSQDFNEMHQLAHVGLDCVTFPQATYTMLANLRGRDGRQIPSYREQVRKLTDVEYVDEGELTAHELDVIRWLHEFIDPVLPGNAHSEIKIYEAREDNPFVADGFASPGWKSGPISLLRSVLESKAEAAFVYIHEKTHANSGGSDADAAFRDYLTGALAKLAIAQAKDIVEA